ncbi:MAG: THUMP domain-containing protein [Candidatus Bathyarchaeia archaeon]|nr:THUMP domain-containing protein [Candidatus Bathyarchaeia archaeon]MDI6904210.1 THUMP domain-containing protein [Candidatus Bathyarchaeia archaeon]
MTSHRYGERELLEQLRELGDFYQTGFKDVVRGRVENLEAFLQELEKGNIFTLSRVVPIEKSSIFSSSRIVEEFCKAVEPLLEKIRKGESFSVIVERRGLKGAFSSQEVARDVGTFISKVLEERDGEKPEVNLRDPDRAVIFETLGRWCGVGIISREMREKYFYLKLP